METRFSIRFRRALGAAYVTLATLGLPAAGQSEGSDPSSAPRAGSGARLIDLRPRFEKGQEIRYEMRTETTTTFEADAGAVDLDSARKIQQQLDLLFKVIESDPEKGSKVEVLVERVTARITTDNSEIAYDSAKPPKDAANREAEMAISAFGKMVGSSVLITIEPSGRISSISAPSTLDGASSFEAVAMGGSERLTSTAGGIGLPFGEVLSMGHPTGLVKAREEWTNTDTLGGLGMNMITTHKVRSASGNTAKVAIEGKIEPPSQGGDDARVASMIKGFEFEGAYDWDTAAGQLHKMDVQSRFRIERGEFKFETQMVCGVRRVR